MIFFRSYFITYVLLSCKVSQQLRQALKYLRFLDHLIIPLSLPDIMLVSPVRFRHFVFTIRCCLSLTCNYIILTFEYYVNMFLLVFEYIFIVTYPKQIILYSILIWFFIHGIIINNEYYKRRNGNGRHQNY